MLTSIVNIEYFSSRSGELNTRDWKTRDWKTRERIGYGKPIKPKQPTHFQKLI